MTRSNDIRPCPSDPTAVEIHMGGGLIAVIDADVAAEVATRFWSRGGNHKATYARACENGKRITLHRFLWRLWGRPATRYIDHEDRDGLNNRRSNLRAATPSQNGSNRKPTQPAAVKTSRFKGVARKRGKKWTALIGVNGKYIHLGTFEREEDAAEAYRQAALKYHGEFGRTWEQVPGRPDSESAAAPPLICECPEPGTSGSKTLKTCRRGISPPPGYRSGCPCACHGGTGPQAGRRVEDPPAPPQPRRRAHLRARARGHAGGDHLESRRPPRDSRPRVRQGVRRLLGVSTQNRGPSVLPGGSELERTTMSKEGGLKSGLAIEAEIEHDHDLRASPMSLAARMEVEAALAVMTELDFLEAEHGTRDPWVAGWRRWGGSIR